MFVNFSVMIIITDNVLKLENCITTFIYFFVLRYQIMWDQ